MIAKLLRARPNLEYPLMRDPQRNPKCYEMTEQERLAALLKVDELLKDRDAVNSQGYYGA
jgi:hypothetical protein